MGYTVFLPKLLRNLGKRHQTAQGMTDLGNVNRYNLGWSADRHASGDDLAAVG